MRVHWKCLQLIYRQTKAFLPCIYIKNIWNEIFWNIFWQKKFLLKWHLNITLSKKNWEINMIMKKIGQNNKQISLVCIKSVHLKYYFNIKVCLSFHSCIRVCLRRLAPIPAGESQDVTNKSCSVCLRGDKNDLWVTLGVPGVPKPWMYSRSGYYLENLEMELYV